MNLQLFMKQIELAATIDRKNHQSPSHELKLEDHFASRRKQQSTCIFLLVCLMQVINIILSILLLVVPIVHKQSFDLPYITMTFVRCIIFFICSVKQLGLTRKLFSMYLLLDSVFVMQASSIVTYTFLNYKSQVRFTPGAIICYPILLFFLVGNYRVMLVTFNWQKWQVLLYKIIKIMGTLYFLAYGSYLAISSGSNQLLLLWVFITSGFWGEMCFGINTMDASDNMQTKYLIQND